MTRQCEPETFHIDRPITQSTPIKSIPSSNTKATKRGQSESNEHGVKILYTYTMLIYIWCKGTEYIYYIYYTYYILYIHLSLSIYI